MNENETGFFGDLWDNAKGVFKDYIDFESFKFEKQMANDRWQWERENSRKTAPVAANYAKPKSDLMSWIIGAVVIGGAVFYFKK